MQGGEHGAVLRVKVNDMGRYGCYPDCTEMMSMPRFTESTSTVNLIKRRPMISLLARSHAFNLRKENAVMIPAVILHFQVMIRIFHSVFYLLPQYWNCHGYVKSLVVPTIKKIQSLSILEEHWMSPVLYLNDSQLNSFLLFSLTLSCLPLKYGEENKCIVTFTGFQCYFAMRWFWWWGTRRVGRNIAMELVGVAKEIHLPHR